MITFIIDESGFLKLKNNDVRVKYTNEEPNLKEYIRIEKDFINYE